MSTYLTNMRPWIRSTLRWIHLRITLDSRQSISQYAPIACGLGVIATSSLLAIRIQERDHQALRSQLALQASQLGQQLEQDWQTLYLALDQISHSYYQLTDEPIEESLVEGAVSTSIPAEAEVDATLLTRLLDHVGQSGGEAALPLLQEFDAFVIWESNADGPSQVLSLATPDPALITHALTSLASLPETSHFSPFGPQHLQWVDQYLAIPIPLHSQSSHTSVIENTQDTVWLIAIADPTRLMGALAEQNPLLLDGLTSSSIYHREKEIWGHNLSGIDRRLLVRRPLSFSTLTFILELAPNRSPSMSTLALMVGFGGSVIGVLMATALHLWQRSQLAVLRGDRINQHLSRAIEAHFHARGALRESQEQLQAILDSSSTAIFVKNHHLEYIRVNPAFARLFSFSPEEMLGKTDEILFPKVIAEQTEQNDRQVLSSGKSQLFEERMLFGTQWRDFLTVISPISDTHGDVKSICGIATDVTERSQMIRQLQTAHTQLTMHVENTPLAAIEWDADWVVRRWSPRAEEIFGWTAAEMVGCYWQDVACVHPDDVTMVQEHIEALTNQRGTGSGVFQNRNLAKGGRTIHCQWHSSVMRNAEGEIQSIFSLVLDITARQEAEIALSESEAKFRQLAESIREVFWIVSADRQHSLYISPGYEQIWGRSCQSLYDDPLSFIEGIHPGDRQKVTGSFFRQQLAGQEAEVEFRVVHLDGSIRWVRDRAFPIVDEGGRVLRIAGIAEDITRSKRDQEQIQRQSQRVQLAADIAQRIHQSLNLDDILATTTTDIRHALDTDYVAIYRFESVLQWQSASSSHHPQHSYQLQTVAWSACSFREQATTDLPLAEMGWTNPAAWQDQAMLVIPDGQANTNVGTSHPLSILPPIAHGVLRACLGIPILAGDHIWGLMVAYEQLMPHQWTEEECELFSDLATQVGVAIQQAELYDTAQQQISQQVLLNRIIENMRDSLDRNTVLQDAVDLTLKAFGASRCLVATCLASDDSFTYSYGAHAEGVESILGISIPVKDNPHATNVFSSYLPVAVDNVQTYPMLTEVAIRKATEMQLCSLLTVAIRIEGELIGVLSLHQCDRPRSWTGREQQLLKRIADQLAVAIQQSNLFAQVQQLNEDLETLVDVRTEQLSTALDYAGSLQRITDRLRDSLDEGQILQTAVEELTIVLDAESCQARLYDRDAALATVAYESTTQSTSAIGLQLKMDAASALYGQLLNRWWCQYCEITPEVSTAKPITPETTAELLLPATTDVSASDMAVTDTPGTPHLNGHLSKVAILPISDELEQYQWQQCTRLAVPIADDSEVLGDIRIRIPMGEQFSKGEVQLAKQVANQCAIALRQARLYEASLAQVRELHCLNLLKDDFLSTVSHELRSPVANIKMSLHMLELMVTELHHQIGTDQAITAMMNKLEQYLGVLEGECDREINLIQNLLDLQRLEAGTEILHCESIKLEGWLSLLVDPFIERAEQRQQTLSLQFHTPLDSLFSDRSHLQRIICELLLNACKYTPTGGQIRLLVSSVSEGARFQIENTGVTIPPADLEHIFDKFYRVNDGDRWKEGGTGLGLALIQRVVEALQGTITVSSKDDITCFVVELPNLESSGSEILASSDFISL